jgi:hypothetical protein
LWHNHIEIKNFVEEHQQARKSLGGVEGEVERVPAMIVVGVVAVPEISEESDQLESVV